MLHKVTEIIFSEPTPEYSFHSDRQRKLARKLLDSVPNSDASESRLIIDHELIKPLTFVVVKTHDFTCHYFCSPTKDITKALASLVPCDSSGETL
jgi:hypothetical protein